MQVLDSELKAHVFSPRCCAIHDSVSQVMVAQRWLQAVALALPSESSPPSKRTTSETHPMPIRVLLVSVRTPRAAHSQLIAAALSSPEQVASHLCYCVVAAFPSSDQNRYWYNVEDHHGRVSSVDSRQKVALREPGPRRKIFKFDVTV